MKKIFKLLFLSLIIISFSSCDNNAEKLVISPQGSVEITAPMSGFTQVLNPEENQKNIAFTLTWNPADFGLPTKVTYNVEFADSGTDFATPFLAKTTTNTYSTWDIGEFNGVAVSAGLFPFVEGNLDVRIVATVGTQGVLPQVSDVITITVTPFTTDLPTIAVPGNHQGWDPPTAPILSASAFGATDFEGYVWLDGQYKFIAPDSAGNFQWGNTDWGDASGVDGVVTGILTDDGEGNSTADAGYYFVKADTEALTYSTKAVSWGIIGAATPNGWDSDTDFTYDSATRTLIVDIDLVPGPFKFRGNNEWAEFDLGTLDGDGFLQGGGDLTFDGSAGNYRVVLDLSNPREFTFSITAN